MAGVLRSFPRLAAAASLTLAATLFIASEAGAVDTIKTVKVPIVWADAQNLAIVNQPGFRKQQVKDISDILDENHRLQPLEVLAQSGGARMEASEGDPQDRGPGRGLPGSWASADAQGDSGGSAESWILWLVDNKGPDSRGRVRVTIKFGGATSIGPSGGLASWSIRLWRDFSTDGEFLVRDGQIERVLRLPILRDLVFQALLFTDFPGTAKSIGEPGAPPDRRVNEFCRRCPSGGVQAGWDLLLFPGTYLIHTRASAEGPEGVAYVDPVLSPHPDDPNAVVRPAVNLGPTTRRPFSGRTAEDLAARGLDPQPFIELGVLDPPTPPVPADTTAPSTTATPAPGPNAQGWNNGAVTVDLAATDEPGGSGVKELHFALAGATTTGDQVVAGGGASVAISAEGETTLTYFAVDNAGNQEAPKSLTVRIDQTPPVIAGMPAPGCTLWPPDHRMVQVASVTASDPLSGLVPGSLAVSATSSQPSSRRGQGAGESDIVITGGTVQVRADRSGRGNERVYTISATATDQAGNTATATGTCTVPHDQRQAARP